MICKKCGSVMVKRNGPYGPFYGCSSYPKCKNIVKIKKGKAKVEKKFTDWNSFVPSTSQKIVADSFMAILKGISDTKAMLIKSTAGSGKTKILEYLVHLGLAYNSAMRILAVSFTKDLTSELKIRMPDEVEIRTFNSWGNQAITTHSQGKFNEWYLINYLRDLLGVPYRKGQKFTPEQKQLISVAYKAKAVIEGIKNLFVTELDTGTLREICDRFNIETMIGKEDREGEIFQLARLVIEESWELSGHFEYDYTDQNYLPAYYGWVVPNKYDLIVVDENQDLSYPQIKILTDYAKKNPDTIFVLVGDDNQSIYQWRGAVPNALDLLKEKLQCDEFFLAETWRNPTSHVALINERLPFINHKAVKKEEGTYEWISEAKFSETIAENDLVLCRQNAPLVPYAYRLLKQGKKAIIKGKDIGRNLVKMIANLELQGDDKNQLLISKIEDYRQEREGKLREQGKNNIADLLVDQVEVIKYLAENFTHVSQVIEAIDKIFSDKNAPITFSSIHKAKGLESERVFILRPDLLSYEEGTEEANVSFVALSRSSDYLAEVDPES